MCHLQNQPSPAVERIPHLLSKHSLFDRGGIFNVFMLQGMYVIKYEICGNLMFIYYILYLVKIVKLRSISFLYDQNPEYEWLPLT